MDARWLVALLAATALAGCVGDDTDDVLEDPAAAAAAAMPADWYLNTIPHLGTHPDHDHSNPEHHEGLSTPNFQINGWNPLITEYHGTSAGTYYCGEVTNLEDRSIAVYNSFSSDVAMVVVDVTDPYNPVLLGYLALPLTHTYDAAITDDGRFAALATSPLDTGPDAGVPFPAEAALDVASPADTYVTRATFTDRCGNVFQGPEENLPFASGVVLVDLADLTEPVVADFVPQPIIGAHSVSAHDIDGVRYIAASTTNLVHPGSYFSIYTAEEIGGVGKLVPAGVISSQYLGVEGVAAAATVNGHVDAHLQKHPITGQTLAYLSNWGGGLMIYELTAPLVWTPVSMWDGLTSIHEATPQETVTEDGRHFTLIGQEGGQPADGQASHFAAILDTTDPANPFAVAWWTLPFADLQWDAGGLQYSTHYVQLVNDTLYVALYHGGVWAADASEENWPALPTIGAFVPTPQEPMERPATGTLSPEVLDVNPLPDGRLVIIDSIAGAFVVEFDPDLDVPVAPPLGIDVDFIG